MTPDPADARRTLSYARPPVPGQPSLHGLWVVRLVWWTLIVGAGSFLLAMLVLLLMGFAEG